MTNTYAIAHGSKAGQAARIIAEVNRQPRPTVAPQQCGATPVATNDNRPQADLFGDAA